MTISVTKTVLFVTIPTTRTLTGLEMTPTTSATQTVTSVMLEPRDRLRDRLRDLVLVRVLVADPVLVLNRDQAQVPVLAAQDLAPVQAALAALKHMSPPSAQLLLVN